MHCRLNYTRSVRMAPINMPVGYRFLPTDEELIKDYLFNKVFCGTVPAQIIQDITAEVFFNVHPSALGILLLLHTYLYGYFFL